MERKDKINLAAFIIVSGFAFSVFYHYISSQYLGLGYPFNSFLVYPDDRFNDFFHPYRLSLHPYEIAAPFHSQFPFLYLIASAFSRLGRTPALGLFLFIFVASFVFIVSRNVKTDDRIETLRNVFVFSFLSFPFLFTIDRANYEALLFPLLYLFVYFYQAGRLSLGAVCLGTACAIKPFPLVFLVLLLSEKQYKAIFVTCLIAVGLSLIAYASFGGGILYQVDKHLACMDLYNRISVLGDEGLYFTHSLFNLFRILLYTVSNKVGTVVPLMFKAYYFLAFTLFALCAAFVVRVKAEMWEKVALLIFAMNLLPHLSADYNLLQVFIPLFMFTNLPKHRTTDMCYTVLFALLLIPKDYYHFPHIFFANRYWVTVAAVINPLIMLAMSAKIVIDRLAPRPASKED